jgi:predicted small secreted protein
MKKLFLALALVAVPLAACSTIRTVDQAVALANQDVGDYTVLDEKSWYYAEALYNVPARAYLSTNSRGLIHDPLKSQIKSGLQKLDALRQAVYQAYKTGNAVAFRDKITEMKTLSDQVRNLIPAA